MREDEMLRGLRRAMVEMVLLRLAAERRITKEPSRANKDRRAQVRAYQVAYNRLNQIVKDVLPTPSRESGEAER